MSRAEVFSLVAILISLVSLASSIYFSLRDRARVWTKSEFYPANEFSEMPHMRFSVVNIGRRPLLLRMWGGVDESGAWSGTVLGGDGGGRRLAENERYEQPLNYDDIFGQGFENDMDFTDLWVEDSLGRRYPIKGAKDHLRMIHEAYRERARKRKMAKLLLDSAKPD